MVDRANGQVMLEFLECLFDLGELDVERPQLCGIVTFKVGAQQIAAFAVPHRRSLARSSLQAMAGALVVSLEVSGSP